VTRPLAPVFFVAAVAVWVTAPVAGQDKTPPDRTPALDKARVRFEADIARAEEQVLVSLEKALAKSGGSKQFTEKLTYERDLFVAQRIPPTTILTGTYAKQRGQSIAALEAVYFPAIKELAKAEKTADAENLEAALSELVKGARGYGLALPALEGHPLLLIENKATGLLLDVEPGKGGPAKLIVSPKTLKKATQQWYLDREEKGAVLRNAGTKTALGFDTKAGAGPESLARMVRLDPTKDVPDAALFRLAETRRQLAVVWQDEAALSTSDRKLKGVTVTDVVFDKPDSPPSPRQMWVVTETK
jgi:hypothetical protein